MFTALSFVVLFLALLSFGATVPPTHQQRGLPLKRGQAFTHPNGTFDHESAILHNIDVFNKYQRSMRILNRTGNLPDGWKIMDYMQVPRALQKRANSGAPLVVGGPPGPLWTTQVSIGTPFDPQDPPPTFTVLIDTGSTDLWVPDIQCGNACKNKNMYNDEKSMTSTQIKGETYIHAYDDGLKIDGGFVYEDVVEIAMARAFPLLFGTATDIISGPTVTYADSPYDGILGLALLTLSKLPPANPLIPFLFLTGQITRSVFSLRLSNNDLVSEIFLGDVNPAKFVGPFETHHITMPTGFFVLSGGSVVVGAAAVVLNLDVVLDSGGNFITGDPASVAAFYQHIPGSVLFNANKGFYAFPCAPQLPNIALSFGQRQWPISRATFDFGPLPMNPAMCMGGIVAGDIGTPPGLWVAGAVFLQNVYSVFDPMALTVSFATPQ